MDGGPQGAWIFTRANGVWTQQGRKLVGSGAVGSAHQGISVALSADGDTAIVGGWSDKGRTGAAWVFTRSGGIWKQQGRKLVGNDAVGSARQGMSVALSADGNTAIVGGPGDNPWDRSVPFGLGAAGAAWVFTRSNGVWTQQGSKLVGAAGSAGQGSSVALSADGDTAVLGGSGDDGGVGAASVFTRAGGRWTLDHKLAGTGAVGKSASSVALSADGTTVMVGGSNDNGGVGAAWVFTRRDVHWAQVKQKKKKLVDAGTVAKSAGSAATDGSTVPIEASGEQGSAGAAPGLTCCGNSDRQEPQLPSAPSIPTWNLEE